MLSILTAFSEAASRAPALKRLVPAWLRRRIYARLFDMEIASYVDRVHMREVVVPFLCQCSGESILVVGCRRYSVEITLLVANGKSVSTIDIDPAAKRWGSAVHITGDATFLDKYFEPRIFDAVIINGVLGYGINTRDDISRAFLGLSCVIKPRGVLILGWNTDRIEDPTTFDLAEHFRRLPNCERVTFEGSTHTYELFGAALVLYKVLALRNLRWRRQDRFQEVFRASPDV